MKLHKIILYYAYIQDKENKHVKLKSNLAWPDKRQDFVVRGPLGELNTNIPIQRKLAGRVAVIIAEFENKAAQNRVASQRYSNMNCC